MIHESGHEWAAGLPYKARLCIIGAGAAGISLACELDGCGFDVLLLEAGGLASRVGEFYEGSATAPHPDPTQFRRVGFGGTTAVWGGRCVPFDPIDFEHRDYVANSGWPIAYEEVARFYPAAMDYCDAGRLDFLAETSLPGAGPIIPGFRGDDVIDAAHIERYSLPTNFGKRYWQRLRKSANVTVVLGLRCLKLNRASGEDRIESAEVIDDGGRRRILQADAFVLATGGIEVPRLLLASDDNGTGFGNLSECLGRFYMCHFENTCGRIIPHKTPVAFRFERTSDGVYCRRQMRFTPEAQRDHHLLNTVFRLHFPGYADASHGSAVMSAIYLAKSSLLPEYRSILQQNPDAIRSPPLQHVGNILRDFPGLVRFAGDWLFRIRLAKRKLPYTLVPNADGSFPLEFNAEQTPDPSNRITLQRDRDRGGVPRVHIAWRLSEEDAQAAVQAFHLLRKSLEDSGTARLLFDDELLAGQIARSIPLGHHVGTARMAATANKGVVDDDCSVFGLPNLYVASSAVFPTCSHANPTLTIVALALRLAQHLRTRLDSRPTAGPT
jgi:choline dehydrogenase-like flavoprotein